MELRTDHSFHIGEQHLRNGKPCQDYALSGRLVNGAGYAIVSDGCSSGGKTDIGARLLTLATERALKENESETSFGVARDTYAETFRNTLGLEHRDMLATNLFALWHKDKLHVHTTGDGIVALQYETGLQLYRFGWDGNMPYYPAYRLAGEDQRYKEAQSKEQALTMTTDLVFNAKPDLDKHFDAEITTTDGMRGMELQFSPSAAEDFRGRIKAVGIFSDGVEQVDGLDEFEVVSALMSFKSTSGQFATRRMNRFLAEAKKTGRGPIDDIAMAVIHLDHGSET